MSQEQARPAAADGLGLALQPGDAHYRAYVGPPRDFDLVAAMSFGLMTALGLRQQHRVLDIGCGSLRVGRLLIPYLNAGGYAGVEPNGWLVEDGIRREVGQSQVDAKRPRLVIAEDAAELLAEGAQFDFCLAQSIFSHTGLDLLDSWLSQASRLLKPDGALVATFLRAEDDSAERGWIYPDCVAFRDATLASAGQRHGLRFVPLSWRHPRQTWMLMAKPGFDTSWIDAQLSWNAGFDHLVARAQSPDPA